MNAATWIALLSPALAVCGTAVMATAKMTRLIDAVQYLGASMEKIVNRVDDHERRLNEGGL